MSRFFVDRENVKDNTIRIVGEDVNHIKNVLRYTIGDKITACNGCGTDYFCEIKEIGKDFIELSILDEQKSNSEPSIKITLYQGIPKKDKMELIIQKCVELGVVEIVPVVTERVIVQIKDKKKEKNKLNRWNKISEAAAKQSNRGIIPAVRQIISFNDAMEDCKKLDKVFFAYENEQISLKEELEKNKEISSIGIFIGPEGGFTSDEVDKATKAGLQSISLGNRILRTETAGIALMSAIMYAFDEM